MLSLGKRFEIMIIMIYYDKIFNDNLFSDKYSVNAKHYLSIYQFINFSNVYQFIKVLLILQNHFNCGDYEKLKR